MPRNITSAKGGKVNVDGSDVQDITDSQVVKETDGLEYATSSTDGEKFENAGHKKRSGSFSMKDDDPAIKAKEGTVVDLIVTTRTGKEAFNGKALLKTMSPSIPVEGGDNVVHSVTWAAAEGC